MLRRYRATGADPPFGDPRRPHGVAMEGWFWRFTDVAAQTVAVVLLGVNRDAGGRGWGTVGLAVHPGGFSRSVAAERASASGLRVVAEHEGRVVAEAEPERLRVDLGPGARLDVRLDERFEWPRAVWGGLGAAQVVPALSQYWHPWLLGARVTGTLEVDGRTVVLDGATAYAEKNWGAAFPPAWWWGQAHGFERDDVCVAFAGGRAGLGPLRATATSLVVRDGDRVLRVVRPLRPMRVDVSEDRWSFTAPGIEVEGRSNGTPPHLLPVPLPAQRRNLPEAASQHLAGQVRLRLHRRGRTTFEGVSLLAGLEVGGAPPAARPAPAARPRSAARTAPRRSTAPVAAGPPAGRPARPAPR